MPTIHKVEISRPNGITLELVFDSGHSTVIVGANGSGKTRLGVHIEAAIVTAAHRISAQKSLAMSNTIQLISLERATSSLHWGYPDKGASKRGHRWQNNPATHQLSDFDFLQQTLFAEHNRVASRHLQDRKIKSQVPIPTTSLERLKSIWDLLLPHRTLLVSDSTIHVAHQSSTGTSTYLGSEMSDGERAIFYFLGQALRAPPDSVIIVDEPEGHIHKAILATLWDAIELARPDCALLYISHDLEFALSRATSEKYFVREYSFDKQEWDIEKLPKDSGLPDPIVVELVGSRKPVLFVEGERGSIDLAIYRHQYRNFTIMPVGSCEAVIHSVASYRVSSALHWLKARGLVDADHRIPADIASLHDQGVDVLPVAEIENLLLLPGVFLALAAALACSDPDARLASLRSEVMKDVTDNIDLVSSRYATRQLDRCLKRVGIHAKDLVTLESSVSGRPPGYAGEASEV